MTYYLTSKRCEEVGTREVYGKALSQLAREDERIFSLDADMKNSTFSEDFLKIWPERFIECFIAEQNMVSVAVGLARLGRKLVCFNLCFFSYPGR